MLAPAAESASPGRRSALCARLHALGEHMAAGFLEFPAAIPMAAMRRMARGIRRQLERADPPVWRGEALYPAGAYSWYAQGSLCTFSYSHSLVIPRERLAERTRDSRPDVAEAYRPLAQELGSYFQVGSCIDRDVSLGGANYTHSILSYGRIVREGLNEYARRVRCRAGARAGAGRSGGDGVLPGAARMCWREYRRRMDERSKPWTLIAGDRLPASPGKVAAPRLRPGGGAAAGALGTCARFLRGAGGRQFLYYIDGCDNLGRFDQDLGPLYEADLDAGRITEEDGTRLVKQMWANIDANSGWNVAIGGSLADGSSASNRLTLACLRAAHQQRTAQPGAPCGAEHPRARAGCGAGCHRHGKRNPGAIQRCALSARDPRGAFERGPEGSADTMPLAGVPS